ncbi:unnamed protein product [Triticum turgidum subsp. durum]|uniref:CCT domain-containing protein n=1 Tax=Triticum turgidum subsp. durum TaxID=4567 RepID=A0A9R0R1D8_TRITD|nr:unnamed protein product [Triticum turgidum subsp. durum]
MFNPSSSPTPTYSDPSMHHAWNFSGDLHTAPTEIPRGTGFFHSNGGLFSPVDVAASAPPSCISPLPPYNINTSTSSHPLPFHLQFLDPLNGNAAFSCPSHSTWQLHPPPFASSPSSSSGDFFEFSSSDTMRRVLSTGDLQGNNVSPPLPPPPIPPQFPGDNCSQEAGDPFSEKVGRYSAEERKERIERYRAKRQQRNFHKKITYACRKTLADSRPRVQGRFARNLEAEGDMETEVSDISYEYCPYDNLGGNRYDSQSQCMETVGDGTAFDDSKWWWGTPVAANRQQQQQLGFDVDDDESQLWASLADMC